MGNWVTLANGVHIDLDDPNNPLTGDGSFGSYLGGGDKGSSKGSYKENLKTALKEQISKNLEHGYPTKAGMKKAISSFLADYPDATNENIVEALNSMSPRFTGRNWSKESLNELLNDGQDSFIEFYNSLPESDRAAIDRQMHADKEIGAKYEFTPTKQTIWNDKSHPLYGIAPSEQNEDYLKSAISEMTRYSDRWSTMSKSERNEISPNGKAALDKQIKQYSKALEYIKSFK